MPAAARHFEQARGNRAHAEYLLQPHAADPIALQRAVTAAFYCAPHCLNGYLADVGIVPRSHVERDYYLADPRYGIPNHVYQAYRRLKERSEGARYLMHHLRPERVRREILDAGLATVTTFVNV